MESSYIHSRQNEQVKNLVKLRERKHRDRQGRFVVEGLREIDHARRAPVPLEVVYFCPECFPSDAHTSWVGDLRRAGETPLVRLSRDAFLKASLREGPDGLIALACRTHPSLSDLELPARPLILVLEGIEKPGNLGAILRSADGAGVDAVALVDCRLDCYNPNTIRSSQGLVFALPILVTDAAPLRDWLAEHGIVGIATSPDAAQTVWEAPFAGACALFLGSESDGLSDRWLKHLPQHIRIPMAGSADSLNVAAAAAVCLYEARRQRGTPFPRQAACPAPRSE